MHNEYVYICMVTRYGEFERPLPACQLASSARSSPGESDRCPKVRDRGPKVSRNRLPKMGVPEKTREHREVEGPSWLRNPDGSSYFHVLFLFDPLYDEVPILGIAQKRPHSLIQKFVGSWEKGSGRCFPAELVDIGCNQRSSPENVPKREEYCAQNKKWSWEIQDSNWVRNCMKLYTSICWKSFVKYVVPSSMFLGWFLMMFWGSILGPLEIDRLQGIVQPRLKNSS